MGFAELAKTKGGSSRRSSSSRRSGRSSGGPTFESIAIARSRKSARETPQTGITTRSGRKAKVEAESGTGRGGLSLLGNFLRSTEFAVGNLASGVGNVATGDLSGARRDITETGKSLGNIVGLQHVTGGPRKRGLSDVSAIDRALGVVPDPAEPFVRAGVDILTDPTTYATFGVGPALKGSRGATAIAAASQRGSRRIADDAARSLREGRAQVNPALVSEVEAEIAETIAAAPRTVKVGLNLPTVRGGRVRGTRFQVETSPEGKIARMLERARTAEDGVSGALNEAARRGFASSRGARPDAAASAQAARRLQAATATDRERRLVQLNRDLDSGARAAGLSRRDASTLIIRHLDGDIGGVLDQVPAQLEDTYRGFRDFFDEMDATEAAAGIEKGVREGGYVPYVPQRGALRKTVRLRRRGKEPGEAREEAFFTKAAESKSWRQYNATLRQETGGKFGAEDDIVRLAQVRSRASAQVLEQHGLRAGMALRKGVRLPFKEDLDKRAKQLDELAAQHERLGSVPDGFDSINAVRAARDDALDLAASSKTVRRTPESQEAGLAAIENRRLLNAIDRVQPDDVERLRQIRVGEFDNIQAKHLEDKGVLVDAETLEEMRVAANSISRVMRDPEEMQAVLSFMQGLQSRWKALALLTPGYHVRNLLDDGLRSAFFGARNPRTYQQAARLIMGAYGDSAGITGKIGRALAAGDKIKLGNQTWDAAELMRAFDSAGVTRSGHIAVEIEPGFGVRAGRQRVPARGPGRGPVARFSARTGQAREDIMRAALAMERMKGGDNLLTAARASRQALFDYGDVGAIVENARTFWMPFVTYTAKAIPQTLRLFASYPGIPLALNRLRQASNEAAGLDPNAAPAFFDETSFGIPVNARFLGGPDRNLTVVPFNTLGVAGVVRMADSLADTGSFLAGRDSSNPDFLTDLLGPGPTAAAATLGLDVFRGRSFFEDEERRLPLFGTDAPAPAVTLLGQFPPVGVADRISRPVLDDEFRADQGLTPLARFVGVPVRVSGGGEDDDEEEPEETSRPRRAGGGGFAKIASERGR